MSAMRNKLPMRACVLAVQAAVAAMIAAPAFAESEAEAVQALTQPVKTIEFGGATVRGADAKFGEYNGINKNGSYAVGAFDMAGGGSYDSDNAFRWSAIGRDLGLRTRSLEIEFGDQGSYRINVGVDEMRRNYADDYQTFYDGAGGSALNLPASFVTPLAQRVSAATTTKNGALSNWSNLAAPYATAACAATGGVPSAACAGPGYLIPAAMHNFEVGTERTKNSLGATIILAPGLTLSGSAVREHKDGTKLTGVAFGGPARGVLVPEVVNSDTSQFRLNLGYVGEHAFLNADYYVSLYRNEEPTWTVENPFVGSLLAASFNNRARLVGAPDNEMHKLALSGGYTLSKTTRLSVSGSYARMTQNDALITGLPSTWSVPISSANAKVVNTSLNATLSDRSIKNLALTANVKYEHRDDRTEEYFFKVAGGDAASAPSLFHTEPLNREMKQFSLEADYSLASRQSLVAGLERQVIDRTSDTHETPWAAEQTRENTLRLDYRNNVSATVNGRIGFAHSQRRHSEYEESELLPVPTVAPLPAADPLLPDWRMFYLADRDRNLLRGSLNWQATDKFSLQTGFDYSKDKFIEADFGRKLSSSWVFKLDAAFAASENLSYSGFYSLEDRKATLESLVIGRGTTATILDKPANPTKSKAACAGYFIVSGHLPSDEGTDPCREWTETQSDKVHTFGFGAKADKLMGGKLALSFDLAYAYSRTPIEVEGGAYYSNGNTATAPTAALPYNNIWIAAESFPDITSRMVDVRLNGVYALSKASALRLNYVFRRLRSSDWQYDAYTNPVGIQVFPGVGMTSPNYSAQVVGLSYVYSFR